MIVAYLVEDLLLWQDIPVELKTRTKIRRGNNLHATGEYKKRRHCDL